MAALAISALAVSLLATSPAAAETLGGEGLAGTVRTVSPLPGADPLPPVKAATWVLADADTGEVLAHKGAHVQRPPASTLKMLTALTVLPQVPPDTVYVATPRAATTYGARVGLRVGKRYTMDELWYAVFLPSANDAAIAVAQANGGVRSTVRQMNDLAYDLRALDTTARNTSGLDAPGQLSSAYDLTLIAREGLTRDDFAHYASTPTARFPDTKGKGTHRIYTTNRLLLHRWKGAIGVKTGFTTRAGRTYVGAATRGGRTLIVSLMGIRESSEEAAKKLLTWGFANADRVEPVGMLVEKGSPIPVASDTESVDGTRSGTGPNEESTDGAGAQDPDDAGEGGIDGATAAAPLPSAGAIPVGVLAAVVAIAGGTALITVRRRGRRTARAHQRT